ncbi:MAG: DUF3347 domain-containing protein [Bacteroidetes bacterium]|nr:DUF3347 domain-containing protein [Bacteroidota bacterium]
MSRQLCFPAILLLFVYGCGNPAKPYNVHDTEVEGLHPKVTASNLDSEGTQQLLSLLDAYYELKNAFVATNSTDVRTKSSALQKEAASAINTLKRDSTQYKLIQPYFDTLINNNQLILNTKDETCEVNRIHFDKVSAAIYKILKVAGLKNAGVYHQFCPMAFNDKGAYWLSNETEIKNPYFGKKMLECGEITDSL